MEFLKILSKINDENEPVLGEDFTEALEKGTTEIMTQKLTSEQGKEMVTKYCLYIPKLDQNYYEQCTDQFLAFALNFGDKNLYLAFKELYQTNFSLVKEDPRSPNDISLYIMRRIMAITNKKWVLLFVQARIEQTKMIEKKFMLLEMLGQLTLEVENKEAFYLQLLPEILRGVTHGIRKFEEYKAKFKTEEMNEKARQFQEYFESWVIDYLLRFQKKLKNIKEIRNYKKLLRITDLVEIDIQTGQVVSKSPNNQTLILHYIILFFLEVFEAISEALNSAGVFDKTNVETFLRTSRRLFEDLIPSPQEFIENMVQQLRYAQFSSTPLEKQIVDYSPYIPYNLTGAGLCLIDLLNSKSFSSFFSQEYKLRILLPYLSTFLKAYLQKSDFVKPLLLMVPQILLDAEILPLSLSNSNYFNTPAGSLLILLLEPVGSTFQKEEQLKFLPTLKLLLNLFQRDIQWDIFIDIALNNSNSSMAAFIFDILRKEISDGIKRKEQSSFTDYQSIDSLLDNVIQIQVDKPGNLADKSSILNSALSTIEFVLMRMKSKLSEPQSELPAFETEQDECFILNPKNIMKFTATASRIAKSVNQRLGDSFDEVAAEKHQIEQVGKEDEDEKKLNSTKNEQLQMLKFHTQSIALLLDEIKNLETQKPEVNETVVSDSNNNNSNNTETENV